MFQNELSYWKTAFNWHDSVSPRILFRVFLFVSISIMTTFLCQKYAFLNWTVGPLEISGAALGLLLIIRTNAGYDRWWEARKLWGGIVNQSRNLAIVGAQYGVREFYWQKRFHELVIMFPPKAVEVLRGESVNNGAVEASNSLAAMIGDAYRQGRITGFEFQALEEQRSQLIDYLGGCERILKTPLPKALDIKVRRFLSIYLILVPLGLAHKMGWYTPLIVLLLSYSLLALDQIGVELQNPFEKKQLSALPLDEICKNIEKSIRTISDAPIQELKSNQELTFRSQKDC